MSPAAQANFEASVSVCAKGRNYLCDQNSSRLAFSDQHSSLDDCFILNSIAEQRGWIL